MDATQFTMWLQGFAELSTAPPTPEQWQSIKEHLQLVFTKVTPPVKLAEQVMREPTDAQRKLGERAAGARRGAWPFPIGPQPQPFFPYTLGDPLQPSRIIC